MRCNKGQLQYHNKHLHYLLHSNKQRFCNTKTSKRLYCFQVQSVELENGITMTRFNFSSKLKDKIINFF